MDRNGFKCSNNFRPKPALKDNGALFTDRGCNHVYSSGALANHLSLLWCWIQVENLKSFKDVPVSEVSTDSAVDGRLDWLPELRCRFKCRSLMAANVWLSSSSSSSSSLPSLLAESSREELPAAEPPVPEPPAGVQSSPSLSLLHLWDIDTNTIDDIYKYNITSRFWSH